MALNYRLAPDASDCNTNLTSLDEVTGPGARNANLVFVALLTSVLLVFSIAAPSAKAASRFDVSYLWHSEEAAAKAYKARVAQVLGPGVAKRLVVVRSKQLFGVIYRRSGDRASAVKVARSHSRLLKSRGLEAAAVTATRRWRVVDGTTTRIMASPPLRSRHVARKSTGSASKPPAKRKRTVTPSPRTAETLRVSQQIERHIKRLRAKGRIAPDERTAWSVYDFTSGRKLVSINENRSLQAASLIKPFVAAAFFAQTENGKLRYGSRSRARFERMIQYSDNGATNWATRQVGGPRTVERILKRRYPGIFRQTRIVEYIPRGGRTYKNRASARDYSRFLYALWNDRLAGGKELKRLMALPGPDRIKTRSKRIPRSARVFNKTGSTARLCADMGIVLLRDGKGRRIPYTFIGIIEKERRASNYTRWLDSRSRVIGEVSDIVYADIARRYGVPTGSLQAQR